MDPTDAAEKKGRQRGRYSARLEGGHLVVVRDLGAELPSLCMKCGTDDGILLRRVKLQWTPVWARLLMFCVIGLVVMLVTTKRVELDVPLCAPCNDRWNAARNVTIVGVAGLIGAFLWLRIASDSDARFAALALLGLVACAFVVVLVTFVRPRTLRAIRIDDREITLGGVALRAAQKIMDGSR
jgi:hypothetical protein